MGRYSSHEGIGSRGYGCHKLFEIYPEIWTFVCPADCAGHHLQYDSCFWLRCSLKISILDLVKGYDWRLTAVIISTDSETRHKQLLLLSWGPTRPVMAFAWGVAVGIRLNARMHTRHGAHLISPFPGRVLDFHKNLAGGQILAHFCFGGYFVDLLIFRFQSFLPDSVLLPAGQDAWKPEEESCQPQSLLGRRHFS